MLPADIIGVSIYERETGSFKFHPGPIFAQVILADEVNRSTPKTQSALLEAMEEHRATAEGEPRSLPEPFFVIATQNPSEQVGPFPLPESQLDRFTMRIELGYPDRAAERALLTGTDRRDLLATLEPCMTPAELMELQASVQKIHVAGALLDYVQAIVEHTRRSTDYVAWLVQRTLAEARAGKLAADAFEGSGPGLEILHQEGLLEKFYSPAFADIPPQTFPKHGYYAPDNLLFTVMGYNTKIVKREEVPASYADLLAPKWRGKLGIEASNVAWFAAVAKAMGEEQGLAYFQKLSAMAPQVRSGHTLMTEP